MPDKYKPPYTFSTHIGAACVTDLMRQCNGKVPPSKAPVKGLARELNIDESLPQLSC
jgi:hypothetical protein